MKILLVLFIFISAAFSVSNEIIAKENIEEEQEYFVINYENDFIVSRNVLINDITYEVINDFENDLIIVNNFIFTLDQFTEAINLAGEDMYKYLLNNYELVQNSLNYEEVSKHLKRIYEHPCEVLRCSRCSLNPNIVPRTNYKKILMSFSLIVTNLKF